MSEDEKNLIDLEVTSFMTACAAGVDALKALLQRERLRRMEQEAASARAAAGEDGGQGLLTGDEGDVGGGGGGGELRAGSRPAHEHAAVTFLFERLKAVTEVAETMQVRATCILTVRLRVTLDLERALGAPRRTADELISALKPEGKTSSLSLLRSRKGEHTYATSWYTAVQTTVDA